MSASETAIDLQRPAATPLRLLVELPPRRHVFLGNLRDLLSARKVPPVALQSAPGEFWADVFVEKGFGWGGLWRSVGCHAIVFVLVVGASRLIAMQPRVIPPVVFDHPEVLHYQASEYLPPLDTRRPAAAHARKASPVLSRQTIISLPREADNRSQTIVTPPKVKLNHDAQMPNIVAWSDETQPRLAIPDAPLVRASQRERLAPRLKENVVAPTPDAEQLQQRRNSPVLQTAVVAPPPQIHAVTAGTHNGLQLDVIAPPPSVDARDTRPLGRMNVGTSAVIAPAPQLPVAGQRTSPRGGLNSVGPVVPPPPSVGVTGGSSASAGSGGRMIALNLHPAVGAPPDPSAGDRRGSFATGPEGRAGASGDPGSSAGAANASNEGSGAAGKNSSKLPAGLYVGNAKAAISATAGDPAGKTAPEAATPDRGTPPRVSRDARPMQPGDAAKLTEAERSVFRNRRFYSVTLNMPNLNSAGGSWIIRFAELNHETKAAAVAADLTQPYAVKKVDPAYPLQLMRENVAGTVILYGVIHADGTVGNVRVLRGVDERLDRFATEALAKWKFDPATKNGEPVDVEATFQVPFRPARGLSNF